MKKVILWKGLYYQSLEYCTINFADDQLEVVSCVIGAFDNKPYKLEYRITATSAWEMVACTIESRVGEEADLLTLQHDGKGSWTRDGRPLPECAGCVDIDISLSPLTNALPINRLKLKVDQPRQIEVVYIDVFGRGIRRARQQYTRLSDHEVRFENVPNDFEAVLTVDERGLVREYPDLFTSVLAG